LDSHQAQIDAIYTYGLVDAAEWRNRHLRPSVTVICRLFGGWNRALEAAYPDYQPQRRRVYRYTDAEIVRALRDHRATSSADWKRSGECPRLPTILSRFGTWDAALVAAGLRSPAPRDLAGMGD